MTARENGHNGAKGRLVLRSAPYYWLRASYERARLAVARPGPPPDGSVRVLAYHRVSTDRDFLAVRPDVFRLQLELLLERGLTPIALRHAVQLLAEERPLDRAYVCVTFDDGYLDNVEVALPHLEELGVPATIFLPTDIITGAATYHWYETPPPPISWDDARAVAAGGLVTFEAHSTTHRALPRLTDEEVRDELVGSRAAIERELGGQVTVFCYPAGLYGEREARMAEEAGYAAAVTTRPGVNLAGDDLYRLRRTTITWADTAQTFGRKVAGAVDTPSGVETWVRARRARA